MLIFCTFVVWLLYVQLRITKAAENVASHLFVDSIVSAVISGDRLRTIRGISFFNIMHTV